MFRKQLALGIFLLLSFSCSAKVLIWDLGGVLFKQNHFGIARSIGFGHFASYFFGDWKSPNIKRLLFDVLNSFGMQDGLDHQKICDAAGNELPAIMCEWLTGKISPKDLIESVHERIEELDMQAYFASIREKRLLKETIDVIFDPQYFAYHNAPIARGMKLLKEAARYCDEAGNPHTLIVLSNWDPYSFDILYDDYASVFTLFDHIVISGDIGLAKPQISCFAHLIKEYNLTPSECYFVDDQLCNIEAARQCGINGLWLKNGNYNSLKRNMKKLGLL